MGRLGRKLRSFMRAFFGYFNKDTASLKIKSYLV